MQTVIVVTSYRFQGKLESIARAYLSREGEYSPAEQAAQHWAQTCMSHDPGTDVLHTPREITVALLRELFPGEEERAVHLGRICALESVANGAPKIPHGILFGQWAEGKDAGAGDYEFLAEVCGASSVLAFGDSFKRAFLWWLFQESDEQEDAGEE
jgi:hypothetical protein